MHHGYYPKGGKPKSNQQAQASNVLLLMMNMLRAASHAVGFVQSVLSALSATGHAAAVGHVRLLGVSAVVPGLLCCSGIQIRTCLSLLFT